MIFSTESIIISTMKYSESTKIVTAFTKEDGMVKLIAKGARAKNSKFGSSLEPLSFTQLNYYKNNERELHLLTTAELLTSFKKIYDDQFKLFIGLSILEALANTQIIHHKSEELFDFLLLTLINLNNSVKNYYSVFYFFLIQLSKFLGFNLEFSEKFDMENINQNLDFVFLSLSNNIASIHDAGYKCFKMKIDTYKFLKNLSMTESGNILNGECDQLMTSSLNQFFLQYFSYHTEKKFEINSLNFLSGF